MKIFAIAVICLFLAGLLFGQCVVVTMDSRPSSGNGTITSFLEGKPFPNAKVEVSVYGPKGVAALPPPSNGEAKELHIPLQLEGRASRGHDQPRGNTSSLNAETN